MAKTVQRLQMMLNFPVNQRLFYALATADINPLIWALEQTAKRPANAQWVQFLRSHDELNLGRLTEEQRQKVFDAFGPEKRMQLYNRGIRRRLTPMLGNNRRRLELAFSLLFGLPGTSMMQYGDEIGMGENLRLPERESARTPMQWTAVAKQNERLEPRDRRVEHGDDEPGQQTPAECPTSARASPSSGWVAGRSCSSAGPCRSPRRLTGSAVSAGTRAAAPSSSTASTSAESRASTR